MCTFCSSFDFGSVGIKYDGGKEMLYSPAHTGDVPDAERFQFCPVCGRSLLPAGVPEMDYYKVQQLEMMLEHETACTKSITVRTFPIGTAIQRP